MKKFIALRLGLGTPGGERGVSREGDAEKSGAETGRREPERAGLRHGRTGRWLD